MKNDPLVCPECGEEISEFRAATAFVMAEMYNTRAVVACTGMNGTTECNNRIVLGKTVTYKVVGSLDDIKNA